MSADADRSLPDSRPLHRLIRQAGTLLRSSWVATGLGVTVGLLLGTLAVLAAIDLFVPFEPVTIPWLGWVFPLDPVFRWFALAMVTVPAALAFFHGVVRPLCRRLGPVQVARRIEDRLPNIHNRLVSAIDLESKKDKQNVSPHFLARLLNEALARIKGFRVSSLLDLVSLRNAALAALIAIAASAAAWALFSHRLPTALARIFFPFADIPPDSGVRYAVEPGDKALLVGEKVRFAARVTEGEPSKLRVTVYGPTGTEPRGFALDQDKVDGNLFASAVDLSGTDSPFRQGFAYRVYGGGTWSKLHRIEFVERPVIASAKAFTKLPAYARIDRMEPVADQATVTGIEGGKVFLRVQGKGDVAEGEIQLLEPSVARLPKEKQEESSWFEGSTPGGVSLGGNWEWSKHRRRTIHTERPTVGTHGHWFQEDPKGMNVSKGDVLFAWVFIPENREPAMLALEWHDGDGWEHRAYWGADKLRDGKKGTASRFHAGPLPKAGEWTRLEVPASKLGLEGKTAKGMGFKLHDGQAFWGRTGTVRVEAESFKVVKKHPLAHKGDNLWEGEFPLVGQGQFRVELRSSHGHPSETQAERAFKAGPDFPPSLALSLLSVTTERPKGLALPLVVDAADDVGVDFIRLLTRSSVGGEFTVRELYSAGNKPLNRQSAAVQIKEFAALKPGDGLRIVAEVQDTKGQKTRTEEYTVRVATDLVLETKLAAADKERDAFLDKLAKLMEKQKKVGERMAELEQEYAEIGKKVDALRDEGKRPDGKPLEDMSKLDPEKSKERGGLSKDELKKLADLQKELAKLGGEEDKNAAEAGGLSNELKKLADDAAKNDVLPPDFADAVKQTSNLFDRVIRDAMKDIGKKLKDAAAPDKGSPDLKGNKRDADKVDADLKGIKDRLEGVKDAKNEALKGDLADAIKKLREKMDAEDAKAAARDIAKELADLKDLIDRLREQLKEAREANDDMGDPMKGEKGGKERAEGKPKTKEELEKEIKGLLDKAKKLLKKSPKSDDPEFPDQPFNEEGKEKKVPPREEDSDEPLPMKKDKGKDKEADKDGKDGKKPEGEDMKKDGEDEEKGFQPRLGGPKEKLDPRYKDKKRPSPKKDGKEDEKGDEKGDMNEKGDESGKLDAAEKALGSDSKSLEKMLDAFAKGQKGKGKEGKESKGKGEMNALADALKEMMSDKGTKEARAMAKAAKALADGMGKGQKGKPQQPGEPMPPPPSDEGNLDGGELGPNSGKLAALDPTLKAMMLKLPPRVREDLIQGLKAKGPEAYRAFVEDYRKRLNAEK